MEHANVKIDVMKIASLCLYREYESDFLIPQFFPPNVEHVHHYQRERASITGLGL